MDGGGRGQPLIFFYSGFVVTSLTAETDGSLAASTKGVKKGGEERRDADQTHLGRRDRRAAANKYGAPLTGDSETIQLSGIRREEPGDNLGGGETKEKKKPHGSHRNLRC